MYQMMKRNGFLVVTNESQMICCINLWQVLHSAGVL